MPANTTPQLRHDIDSGRTGDKVAASDPAVAPLGTDDEAGGASPSPAAVERAWAQEIGRPVPGERGPAERRGGGTGLSILIGAIIVIGVAVALAFIMT